MLTVRSNGSSPDLRLMSQMVQVTFQRGGGLPQPVLIAITLCLGVLALIGLVGNILVVIFFHRGLRELPQNVYVIALAILDMTVCAVVIPSTVYQDVWRAATTDVMCKAFHVLRCSLVTSSAFLLCQIAVDRFAIICFVPGIQTGRRRAVRLIGLTLLLGFAVGTPLGLTTGTRRNVIVRKVGRVQSHPVTVAHCISDYSILSMFTVKVYKACLTLLFLCLLLAIVFFYANIFYFVRRRQRRWDKSRSYVRSVSSGKEKSGGGGGGVGGSDGGGGGSGAGGGGGEGGDEGGAGSVRFAQGHQDSRRQTRVLLETDIDQALGSQDAEPVVKFDILDNDEEYAEEEQTPQVAEDVAVAPEQQRMLSGSQRREDSVVSNRLARAQRHLSERSRKRPHIKTAKVLSIITFFYLLSYLPFFLVFHLQQMDAGGAAGIGAGGLMQARYPQSANNSVWPYQSASVSFNWSASSTAPAASAGNYSQHESSWWHRYYHQSDSVGGSGSGSSDEGSQVGFSGLFMQTVYYFYFINHGVNPIIYGCMNTFFKQQLCGMFNSMRQRCRRGSSMA